MVVDMGEQPNEPEDRAGRPDRTDFPSVLRRHRVAAQLTQEELAERAGCSARSISQLERGRVRYPRPETVRLLSRALGLTPADAERLHALARAEYWADRGPSLSPAAGTSTAGDPAPRPAVPAQLPGDVVGFTGRAAELAELDRLCPAACGPPSATAPAAVIISAVSGSAGVGKTALALHWAHRVAARFPDGQLYVNLRGYDPELPLEPDKVLAQFLRALGVADHHIPADLDERAARYRTELTGRRLLVVADNAATVEQVRPLLPGTPTVVMVVTSRDSLAGLVAAHGARRLDLDPLPAGEAFALMRRLVGDRVDAEVAATGGLVDLCARLPLALRVGAELAASRPGSSLAALVAELNDEQRRLELLDAGGDPRTA